MALKNGTVSIGNSDMDYICFGRGTKHLIILPGLGDGLQTVKGTALPMRLMYRSFAKDYTNIPSIRLDDEAIAANRFSEAAEGQTYSYHFHPGTVCGSGNQPDYLLLPLWKSV